VLLTNGQYSPQIALIQKLDTNGDETETTNFIGNYSVTPERGVIRPLVGTRMEIHTLDITILDTGTFNPGDYGNIVGGLANGINVELLVNGVVISFPDKTIQTNAELFAVSESRDIVQFAGSDRGLYARFMYDAPFILNGDSGDEFRMFLNDDFTGLTRHEFIVTGLGTSIAL